MGKKIFIAYGLGLCILLAYANYNGWDIADSFSSGKWGPKGHSAYHK